MTKTTEKLVSFDDLDLMGASDIPFDLEVLSVKGVKTGAVIKVLGGESEKVQDWRNRQANKFRTQSTQKSVTGKEKIRLAEEDDEFTIENAAVRIVGWSGFDKEYTKDNVIWLMTRNVNIRMQVLQASEDLGNYSKD
jgi:hypothetical protein